MYIVKGTTQMDLTWLVQGQLSVINEQQVFRHYLTSQQQV